MAGQKRSYARPASRSFSARELAELVAALGTGGGLCPLVVRGESMSPTLREGVDTVYLRSVGPSDDVCVGDIAFFWRGEKVVLHRIVAEDSPGVFRVNGDGQLWCEEVARESVFAVVERVGRGSRVMSARGGLLGAWGALWRVLLPVRGLLWKVPGPLRHLVRGAGRAVRGGDDAWAS